MPRSRRLWRLPSSAPHLDCGEPSLTVVDRTVWHGCAPSMGFCRCWVASTSYGPGMSRLYGWLCEASRPKLVPSTGGEKVAKRVFVHLFYPLRGWVLVQEISWQARIMM